MINVFSIFLATKKLYLGQITFGDYGLEFTKTESKDDIHWVYSSQNKKVWELKTQSIFFDTEDDDSTDKSKFIL